MPKRVVIAGATGYLGRHLVAEYLGRGWQVRALVRPGKSPVLPPETELFEAQATQPETLVGLMEGADLAISTLGLTRHAGDVTYNDVDYGANKTLLDAAMAAGVPRFAYVHVLTRAPVRCAVIDAKSRFVAALQAAPIQSLVIRPTGFFSDMREVFKMAARGRVWLLGPGRMRLNPIHGADLARAIAEAEERGETDAEFGGPDVFSLNEIAGAAFAALGTRPRITHLPRWPARAVLALMRPVSPQRIWGPFEFFLAIVAGDADMVAPAHGDRHLREFFEELAAAERGAS